MRHLLALAGILLGCLAVPTAASATVLAYGAVPTGLVSGTISWTITGATDPTDVLRTWLEYGEYGGYTESVAFAAPTTLTYDTRQLADGPQTFRVVWHGYDGYHVDRTWNLTVDNTPPAAPVPIGSTNVTTDRASARLPFARAAGETANLAEGTICDRAGCRALGHRWLLHGDYVGVPLDLGVSTVTLWLRDRAGNADPTHATTWTITRTAPPPPAPRPRVNPGLSILSATAGANRRAITITGRLAIPHTNHVSVSVRARYGRRTRTVKTIAVTSGHDFRTQLVLPSARWRTATVIARVAGNSRYLTVEKRKLVRRPRG